MDVSLNSELSGRLRLGYLLLQGVRVGPPPEPLHAEIERLGMSWRQRHEGREPSAIPELAVARRLYRSLGMDPTRTRPSSEALLRRLLKGDSIYRINSVVDVGNLFSLEFLLPLGLYDVDQIHGSVSAAVGGPNEGYEGIRKDWVGLAGRVALRDDVGPFGNPSSDSLRTSIKEQTRSILMTVFVPGDFAVPDLEKALDRLEALQLRFNGGTRVARGVLS